MLGAYAPPVPAVEIRHLQVRHASGLAVTDLSLTADPGRITALVGPNGAGKTSTIETCVGLRRSFSGEVTVLDTPLPVHGTAATTLHSRVGVMLQDGGLYTTARPREMVEHLASLYDDPDDPTLLLTAVGIDPGTRTPIRRLSGGEQRRVAAAAALVGRPALVFLDEPTAGLDTSGRRAFHDLLRARVSEGLTVVLTTHLMDDVERLADWVVVIARGRDVASGTVADLVGDEDSVTFDGPKHLVTAALEAALPPGTTVTETAPGRYRVTGPLDPPALASIAAWCGQHGVPTRDLRIGARSLEDVVVDLVGDL